MDMFIENKYYRAYLRIVESAASRGTGDEWHHIIPKSLGGTDARENIVHLTEREHFICHSLLVRCTAGLVKRKMHFAYWRMVNGARTYTPNARSYEWARKNFAAAMSNHLSGRVVHWAEKMRGPRPHVNQTGSKNNNWKGVYVTPWGRFDSLKTATSAAPYKIDLTTLSHYCRKYNDKVFVGRATKQFLNGRTPRECGFSFVPKEEHGL